MKLFSNGKIYSMEDQGKVYNSVLISGNKIIKLGDREDLLEYGRLIAGKVEEINLQDRCVLPGFIDAHTHFLQFSKNLDNIYLRGNESLDEVLSIVREFVESKERGEWIFGSGWDKNRWDRLPDRHDLDRVAPSNPVALYSKDVHTLWANSLALEMASINRDTPDPVGGRFERDGLGRPTGIIRENAAEAVLRVIPEPSLEERCRALEKGFAYAHRMGLTGIHVSEGREAWNAYQHLYSEGRLGLRVLLMIPRSSLSYALKLGLRSGLGDEFIRVGPLKLFIDGALGSQTAALFEPYCGSDNRGMLIISEEELTDIVREAAENGIASAIHAIGDRANRIAILALNRAKEWTGKFSLRQRIEHVQLITPEDIVLMKEAGAIASMQPIHIPGDIPKIKRYWGDRGKNAYPIKSIYDAGIPLAFGSDVPVEDLNPLKGIWAAVTRKTEDGQESYHEREQISIWEAVRAYTFGSAYAAGEEDLKGTLAPGKLADMVVLDKDIFMVEPDEIKEIHVEMTIFNGKIVYSR